MLIVYDTLTGNTKKFVHKLPYEHCHIYDYDSVSPFILVTYTINFGQIPDSTRKFMNDYYKNCLGVSSSGNRNWGLSYGKAADLISSIYKVPLISKFELQGMEKDVKHFIERIEQLCKTNRG